MIKTKILFIVLSILIGQLSAQNSLPRVVSGKIERIEDFQSKYIASRTIDIWLPENYSSSTKYATLYMHDGQMLYDPDQSWNKQAWDIDNIASELLIKNEIKNFIVIGIWNGGQNRHQDYFPQSPFEELTQTEKDTVLAQLQRAGRTKEVFHPQSDKYLKFIVKELKPYIDKKYSVFTNKENTFIAGSSMGGLISLYAICEHPKIFGGAACLSTHWVGTFTLENNPVPNSFINYLEQKLPNPKNHKIYFDCGDQTLDAMYPNIQMGVDSLMKRKGYTKNNWVTKYFPGDDHSEKSWSKRLHIPLVFLLRE
jgi:predicted alpha/beta superfamily hydrolase